MRYRRLILGTAGWIGCCVLPVIAGNIKVIANHDLPADTISARELKSVFLGEKNSLDGVRVQPVLERGGAVHEFFLQQYLGKSDSELQTHIRSMVFTGRGAMPKALSSDEDVVSYVARTKGAIGYVGPQASTEGVKILSILEVVKGGERTLVTRIEPDYPEDLRKRAIGGIVRLKVTIAPKGNVESVQILGGNPILGESAASAVQGWKFSPAPSSTTTEITIPFDPSR